MPFLLVRINYDNSTDSLIVPLLKYDAYGNIYIARSTCTCMDAAKVSSQEHETIYGFRSTHKHVYMYTITKKTVADEGKDRPLLYMKYTYLFVGGRAVTYIVDSPHFG